MPAAPPADLDQQTLALIAGDGPADTYLALGRLQHQARRFDLAERLVRRGLAQHPQTRDLWNLLGVVLRLQRRPAEALDALDRALQVDPASVPARVNRANVLLDLGRADAALDALAAAIRLEPGNAIARVLSGRILARLGRHQEAATALRAVVAANPALIDGWLDLADVLARLGDSDAAEAALSDGLGCNPDHPRLLEGLVVLMRARDADLAKGYLTDLAARLPEAAWIHFHLGGVHGEAEPEAALTHYRRAVELSPDTADYLLALAQALERERGDGEGGRRDEAYALARRAIAAGAAGPHQTAILSNLFSWTCAFDDRDGLGGFAAVGRRWAEAGLHSALFVQMGQADDAGRKAELVEQHRIWGRWAEAQAVRAPIRRTVTARAERIRVGFMSSDLRAHPVGDFVQPLFDHFDPSRFEVFAYSYYRGEADGLQSHFTRRASAFRWWPDIASHDAAERIAADHLDLLIDLGGSTHMNRLDVMAWRPARLQASWLGYPHSTGLTTIDHLICDRFNHPADPSLMLERPLVMPNSWIAVGKTVVGRAEPIGPPPSDANGFVTFGTANSPHKFNRALLRAWARIVAATPGARFMFVRPEAGSDIFRRNVAAIFAQEGVDAGRIVWRATRGGQMAAYNDIDITLDTFPLTGGTTTVEALLMGVPVVSLVGAAFFERLSYSILCNAGLADLCATDPAVYHDIALRLAADRARRAELRQGLRAQLLSSALGQPEAFTRDFYAMVERAVAASQG